VWQTLFEENKDKDFMIIAVAMDSRDGAADPWINEVAPTYVSLIDKEHRLADLYNMVNVPQAVWIDEQGKIVRPTENAGAYESFRYMDLEKLSIPEDKAEKAAQARGLYYDALKDWISHGSASRYAFNPDDARAHVPAMTTDMALAHANFRLGQFLLESGNASEAEGLLEEATRLHPDSWNMWRQKAEPGENGIAAGPEFWQRVQSLGDKRYYPMPDIDGMPD